MDLLGRFTEAGSHGRAYRPVVLWTWNDRLEADEVRRQVREMARGGLGGHVMAAGRGLDVPYAGPAWMDAVRAAVDEGGHTGVAAWLSDEADSRSGWGGGRGSGGREVFRQQSLVLEEVSDPGWEPTEATVAVYVAERDGRGGYRAFRRVDQPRALCGKTPGPQEAFLHFFRRPGGHPDPLSREATEEFLKQTHHRYRETVGGEFGRGVPGIFTRGLRCAGGGQRVPWSPHLVRYFRRSCDYDLLDHLPELFYPVGPYRKTRFDFYETLTRLFLLAWTMPVYQWCDRHGLRLAGHLGGADTLLEQVRRVGAAMPHYEYMHVPGVAWPGREPGRASAVREAASVAAQFGRRRVLAEAFEAAGWGLSLDRMRFLAEWQLALGVNFLCTHHAAYSLRGERKRDRPPSLHYHQPWWPAYHQWNAYLAGLAAALAAGEERVGVLVIHPVAGAWAEYSPLDPGPVEALQEALDRLVGFLLAAHVPFHFGDELVLERQASVSKGELRVGPCRYHTVVVPETPNLRRSTVALLGRLKRSGGRIVLAGRVPDHVDGEPSDAPARLAEGCLRADPATARGRSALRRALGTGLAVLGPDGRDAAEVLAQWRETDKGHLFYFLHVGESRPRRCRIRLPVEGTPRLLDAATGEARSVRSARCKGGRTLAHTFPPRGSLLVWVPARAEGEEAASPAPKRPSRSRRLNGRWRLRRLDPNVLVLDTAQWRTEEGPYSPPMFILDIEQTLIRRDRQQPIILRLEFRCEVTDLAGRRFALVLEDPAAYEMWYNGMRTPMADAGPYWDTGFRRVDVTRYVAKGRNVIELRRPWQLDPRRRAALLGRSSGGEARAATAETELEPVYLVGDFAVAFPEVGGKDRGGGRWLRGAPRLVDEPETLGGVDLAGAGYPFYAGRLVLERDVVLPAAPREGAVLEFPSFCAEAVTVVVNGQEAGTVWRRPGEVSVDGLLQKGRNHVAVILTTGLRNLLGPHHHPAGDPAPVGPQTFAGRLGWLGRAPAFEPVLDGYYVVDFGLDAAPVLRY